MIISPCLGPRESIQIDLQRQLECKKQLTSQWLSHLLETGSATWIIASSNATTTAPRQTEYRRTGVLPFQEQGQNKEGRGFSHLSPS